MGACRLQGETRPSEGALATEVPSGGRCRHLCVSALLAHRPPGSSYFRYAESSMKNSFGLKYLHRFFNIPFLQLQVSPPGVVAAALPSPGHRVRPPAAPGWPAPSPSPVDWPGTRLTGAADTAAGDQVSSNVLLGLRARGWARGAETLGAVPALLALVLSVEVHAALAPFVAAPLCPPWPLWPSLRGWAQGVPALLPPGLQPWVLLFLTLDLRNGLDSEGACRDSEGSLHPGSGPLTRAPHASTVLPPRPHNQALLVSSPSLCPGLQLPHR